MVSNADGGSCGNREQNRNGPEVGSIWLRSPMLPSLRGALIQSPSDAGSLRASSWIDWLDRSCRDPSSATSATIQVASVRGPQFDVVLSPLDPAIEGAEVFVVGTLAGAMAVICGLRLWREIRRNGAPVARQ